jgi:hypothetical protein
MTIKCKAGCGKVLGTLSLPEGKEFVNSYLCPTCDTKYKDQEIIDAVDARKAEIEALKNAG